MKSVSSVQAGTFAGLPEVFPLRSRPFYDEHGDVVVAASLIGLVDQAVAGLLVVRFLGECVGDFGFAQHVREAVTA